MVNNVSDMFTNTTKMARIGLIQTAKLKIPITLCLIKMAVLIQVQFNYKACILLASEVGELTNLTHSQNI